ncbi:MAG: dual specificity protein phosphatase family protein [Actinobacteria bacterium]|nr:dual specificity protein phosphatase family protein [Actinomycetota bacterium]
MVTQQIHEKRRMVGKPTVGLAIAAVLLLGGCTATPSVNADVDKAGYENLPVAEPAAEVPTPPVFAGWAPPTPELPHGARQIDEGYYLSPMIYPNDIPALKALDIQVVLSASVPDPKTAYLLAQAGLLHIRVPMSDTFRFADEILAITAQYQPEEVFIHCTHGADRTGAITAFLLVMRHKWRVADALYSVLYRAEQDTDGLRRVLSEFCIEDRREPDDPTVGFYSLARADAVGGLKARSSGYRRLVRTTLEQMITPLSNGLCDD